MATTVKMCDMSKEIAGKVFQMLNGENVRLKETNSFFGTIIITDVEPMNLIYPEGWYYYHGGLRNQLTSTTGFYGEIRMTKSNGDDWGNSAYYCTLD